MDWRVLTALNIAGSFIVPLVISHFTTLTLFETSAIGGLVFIGLNGIELLDLAKKSLVIRLSEYKTWAEQDEFDVLLTSLRNDFRNMRLHAAGEDTDLMRQLVRQRVEHLRDDVHLAAESRELCADNNHAVDTRRVTDLFRLGKATYFLEVFKVSNGDKIFDLYGGPYFKQIYDLSVSGTIKEIRALIVVDLSDDAAKDKTGSLLAFYRSQCGYSARAISSGDYNKLHQDSGLEHFEDFGIYGEVLLFHTLSYTPINRGKYCHDAVKIKRHKEFFEACWNLPTSPELAVPAEALSIEQVLAL